MEDGKNGWKILDRDAGVLCREYKFGGGVATTLVFRGKGDGLVVVSPASGVGAEELDALKDFGQVTALVANNGFHWLGQDTWRKHFPEAKGFAPATAIPRLTKKSKFAYEPLENAASLLGDGAQFAEPTGFAGNTFVFVRTKNATYWYPSDILSNIPALPTGFVFKTLMSMTDSAPGYKLFRPSVWLQVKDKKALTSWFDKALADTPPTVMVPAHGGPVERADLVGATRALVAQL
ncbi:MAG: hypothetical protein ACRENE_09195 [Polyangiaceae bacterium]